MTIATGIELTLTATDVKTDLDKIDKSLTNISTNAKSINDIKLNVALDEKAASTVTPQLKKLRDSLDTSSNNITLGVTISTTKKSLSTQLQTLTSGIDASTIPTRLNVVTTSRSLNRQINAITKLKPRAAPKVDVEVDTKNATKAVDDKVKAATRGANIRSIPLQLKIKGSATSIRKEIREITSVLDIPALRLGLVVKASKTAIRKDIKTATDDINPIIDLRPRFQRNAIRAELTRLNLEGKNPHVELGVNITTTGVRANISEIVRGINANYTTLPAVRLPVTIHISDVRRALRVAAGSSAVIGGSARINRGAAPSTVGNSKAAIRNNNATRAATSNVNNLARASTRAGGSLLSLGNFAFIASRAIYTLGTLSGLTAIITLGETWLQAANQIRSAAGELEDIGRIQTNIANIAFETRQDVQAVSLLYSRLRLAGKPYGVDDVVAQRISGTIGRLALSSNPQESKAGIIQLTQGIASNRFSGDELRSVLENLLGVQKGLIFGFQRLYERGEIAERIDVSNIRDVAQKGGLTTPVVLGALDAAQQYSLDFAENFEVTLSQAFTRLGVKAGEYFNELNKSTEVLTKVVSAVESISNNFGSVVTTVGTVVGSIIGFAAVSPLGRLAKGAYTGSRTLFARDNLGKTGARLGGAALGGNALNNFFTSGETPENISPSTVNDTAKALDLALKTLTDSANELADSGFKEDPFIQGIRTLDASRQASISNIISTLNVYDENIAKQLQRDNDVANGAHDFGLYREAFEGVSNAFDEIGDAALEAAKWIGDDLVTAVKNVDYALSLVNPFSKNFLLKPVSDYIVEAGAARQAAFDQRARSNQTGYIYYINGVRQAIPINPNRARAFYRNQKGLPPASLERPKTNDTPISELVPSLYNNGTTPASELISSLSTPSLLERLDAGISLSKLFPSSNNKGATPTSEVISLLNQGATATGAGIPFNPADILKNYTPNTSAEVDVEARESILDALSRHSILGQSVVADLIDPGFDLNSISNPKHASYRSDHVERERLIRSITNDIANEDRDFTTPFITAFQQRYESNSAKQARNFSKDVSRTITTAEGVRDLSPAERKIITDEILGNVSTQSADLFSNVNIGRSKDATELTQNTATARDEIVDIRDTLIAGLPSYKDEDGKINEAQEKLNEAIIANITSNFDTAITGLRETSADERKRLIGNYERSRQDFIQGNANTINTYGLTQDEINNSPVVQRRIRTELLEHGTTDPNAIADNVESDFVQSNITKYLKGDIDQISSTVDLGRISVAKGYTDLISSYVEKYNLEFSRIITEAERLAVIRSNIAFDNASKSFSDYTSGKSDTIDPEYYTNINTNAGRSFNRNLLRTEGTNDASTIRQNRITSQYNILTANRYNAAVSKVTANLTILNNVSEATASSFARIRTASELFANATNDQIRAVTQNADSETQTLGRHYIRENNFRDAAQGVGSVSSAFNSAGDFASRLYQLERQGGASEESLEGLREVAKLGQIVGQVGTEIQNLLTLFADTSAQRAQALLTSATKSLQISITSLDTAIRSQSIGNVGNAGTGTDGVRAITNFADNAQLPRAGGGSVNGIDYLTPNSFGNNELRLTSPYGESAEGQASLASTLPSSSSTQSGGFSTLEGIQIAGGILQMGLTLKAIYELQKADSTRQRERDYFLLGQRVNSVEASNFLDQQANERNYGF